MHPTLTTAVQKRHHFHTLRHGVAAIGLGLGMALSALAADASPAVAATAATPATPAPAVVKVDDSSFQCMRKMLPVRHFYVDNLLGNQSRRRARGHVTITRGGPTSVETSCSASSSPADVLTYIA